MTLSTAKVIAHTHPTKDIPTKTANEFIAYVARVSNPSNQDNIETSDKLINYLLNHKHFSPFEHYYLTLEIETPKDISIQLLRHRSFVFQEFCISGDSLITTVTKSGNTKKVKISDLYKRQQSKQYSQISDNLVRCYDLTQKKLVATKLKEVFQTGVKPVYEVVLDNGRKIKTTLEHKFLTKDGFRPLKELSVDDFVASNGVALHQSFEWLQEAKQRNITNGLGVQGIADEAGVSYHTIRKWLKKHSLQFTPKEIASYTKIWNKGLAKEQQPMFGKTVSEETRQKMRKSSRKGEQSNLYRTGGNNTRQWRKEVADFWYKRKNALYIKFGGICAIRNKKYELQDLQIDHIKPVSQYPELAYEESNIRLIHKDEHNSKSLSEIANKQLTVTWQKITSIEYVGEEMTYDLEVEHSDHNYIAEGIVVHNSGRYQDINAMDNPFIIRETRLQDSKNRQNSLENTDEALDSAWKFAQKELLRQAQELYKNALEQGIAKEVARSVLPIGLLKSRLYITGNVRSFIHYLTVRLDPTTQKEHRELAKAIYDALLPYFNLDTVKELKDAKEAQQA